MPANHETTPLIPDAYGILAPPPRTATSELPILGADANETPRNPHSAFYRSFSLHWLPKSWDVEMVPVAAVRGRKHHVYQVMHTRSLRRRVFLVLTEPDTSRVSAIFFGVLVVTIALMNIVMIMQTMSRWQFTPTDCRSCGGSVSYVFDDDHSIINNPDGVACVCPPSPLRWTVVTLSWLVYFFTVEWILRIVTFEPSATERGLTTWDFICQWLSFLTSTSTILDALAIFPYYVETITTSNGLMSLRLLRLFRVFQLVRLGQYNETFLSLTAVLYKSVPYLKLLLGMMLFGAAFFGSMMYWVEKGEWTYFEGANSYQFVRKDQYGVEEISPFTSIPAAFWWFAVTATTVGYGDTYPTSPLGKWIAAAAMLMGVLVIAFPVSVFSDLWSKELRMTGALMALEEEEEGNEKGEPDSEGGVVAMPAAHNHGDVSMSPEVERSHRESIETPVCQPFVSSNRESTGGSSYAVDDNHVVLRREDLADLVAHFQTINESQRQIRAILRKYKLH